MDSERLRLRLCVGVFSTLLLVGVVGFMMLEKLSLVDSIYFSIVTMATVGYGDIHPQTTPGKMLALALIIGGVGTFLGVIASITDLFVKRREDEARQRKLNLVAGLFFSEMGTGLLGRFAGLDPEIKELHDILKVANGWTRNDFGLAGERLKKHYFTVSSRRGDLNELRTFLQGRVDLLLRLLENPILQEHGPFTELLRAVFHLRDELINRQNLAALPEADRKHLEGDIIRIYRLLAFEWLSYMRYLHEYYGYLLSLAIRVNPFDPEADAAIKD
ncbi:MAG: potassium channel family protein [Pseudomonadota bacterium]